MRSRNEDDLISPEDLLALFQQMDELGISERYRIERDNCNRQGKAMTVQQWVRVLGVSEEDVIELLHAGFLGPSVHARKTCVIDRRRWQLSSKWQHKPSRFLPRKRQTDDTR